MKSWAEVSEAKRGVVALLEKALAKLQGPGAEPVDLFDAWSSARIAVMELHGVANVAESMRAAELRMPDYVARRAGMKSRGQRAQSGEHEEEGVVV